MEMAKSLSSELKEVAHSFREKINHAEDRVDLMNSFSMAAREVVRKSIKSDTDIRIDDITLDIDSQKGFHYSERINTLPGLRELLNKTEIESQIIHLAEAARHRCKHLSRHPEKTNLKIRQR